tara:strand:- start:41 stop:616 length:576 start_codon:yes stop_codon:yes gene_type:complete
MNLDYMVISNFLDNPDKVRQSLIEQQLEFPFEGHFPGKRSSLPDEGYRKMVDEKLESILPFRYEHDMTTSTYCFQLCLEEDKNSWIHMDATDWAGVLYLTPNAPSDSGSLIYTEDTNGTLREANEKYKDGDPTVLEGMEQQHDLTTVISNEYNKLLLIRGNALPHKSNVGGFGDCLENGRLTQVFFFNIIE